MLAGISQDYYVRLEQGRSPRPSTEVLDALARVLLLNTDEHEHLRDLAGHPGAPFPIEREVTSATKILVEHVGVPAIVLDVTFDVLAWNPSACALFLDFGRYTDDDRNILWLALCDAEGRAALVGEEPATFVAEAVADLRLTAARHPGHLRIQALVNRLRTCSDEFRALWDTTADAGRRRAVVKTINHPRAGRLDLLCEVLDVPGRGQRVAFWTPRTRPEVAGRLAEFLSEEA
jgi:hypothetical protein